MPGAPGRAPAADKYVPVSGVLGADYPGLRPEVLVAPGDPVQHGDALFRDRHRPDILITAPQGGIVTQVRLGARRRLSVIEIEAGNVPPRQFDPHAGDRAAVTDLLLASGLWAALLSRPFGRIPDPGGVPDAIFVTAHDTAPLAADMATALAGSEDHLRRGLEALEHLTDGPVYLCQGPGAPLVQPRGRVRVERFRGPHPAGLPGTHVDRLHPVGASRTIWQIHAQDAAAIGHLLDTGSLPAGRVIALSGPGVASPRLLRVPHGARLDLLSADEVRRGNWRLLSGSPLGGHAGGYLRRHHWQVTVTPDKPDRPGRPARWRGRRPAAAHRQRPPAIIPTRALEMALGPAIPAMPLIRALSSGDVETAARLGCHALVEEDIALLDYAAGGDTGLDRALRRVLDDLEAAT